MLSALLELIKSTAFLYISGTLAGVGIAALLARIWQTMGLRFFLLALGGVLLCLMLIVAIVLLWRVLERKRADSMEQALGQDAVARQQQKQQTKLAVQSIKERWAEAMTTLKATKVRIYDLPWVLLIGEPQSGKTTTLRESGLDFPLGKDSLSGAGGTVNCDWWFTNDAVILDTAGRFTMPVDSASDKEEWHSFLRLLARHRPRCPINGVIVTIPATSLLQDPPETVKTKALTIREKLQELVNLLGVEFPVYIMVSKLDLVYGFTEFCASLSNDDRRQALGWNRQTMVPEAFRQDEFDTFFAALINRLQAWARRRLRDVPSGAESDRMYAFPGEFNRLKDTLGGYLSLIFRPDRYHIPLLLRGCYFSSGMQEGRSIARALLDGADGANRNLLGEFAKSFVQSRAYFINAFYTKVFKERWLVKRAGGATKREVALRLGAAAFAMIFVLIAATLLVSGYRTLVGKVQPLEKQVRAAQAILIGDKAQQPVKASEIVAMISSLEAGRQEVAAHGARRFLKSSGNTLIEDVGLVEDALFERKFLDALIAGIDAEVQDPKGITSMAQKERMHKMVMQYIDILAGRPVNVQSMALLLDLVSWKDPQGVDIARPEAEQIIKAYPYSRKGGKGPRYSDLGAVYVRHVLTALHNFWDSYYGQLWKTQQQLLERVNTTYGALLGALADPQISTVAGNERFVQRAQEFIEAVAQLDPDNDGKVPVWSAALKDQCRNDYRLLIDTLAGSPNTTLPPLGETAKRHAPVCAQLEQGVGSQWAAAMAQNSHILQNDGALNPEMFQVRDAVRKVAQFGPLFTAEMKERLRAESENPLPVMDAWSQRWLAAREELIKQYSAGTEKVAHMGWRPKELLDLFTAQLNLVMLRANEETAREALKNTLGGDLKATAAQGMETPKAMRAAWLAARFRVLQKIGDWFQARHPGAPALAELRSATATAMTQAWSGCVKFWAEKLSQVDPAGTILKTSNWKSFRREVLARKGAFVDFGSWPLSGFAEHMAYKDVQEIVTMLTGGEASAPPSPQEQKVVNTSAVYSTAKFLPQLEEAQSAFNSIMESLSDDPTEAYQMLQGGKGGERVSQDNLKALGDFQKRVNRDPAGHNEFMAMRLAKIEEHAHSLLKRDFSAGSGKDVRDFVATWQGRIGNQFPFGRRGSWSKGDALAGNSRQLLLASASKGDLQDFFFAPDKGLEALLKKYAPADSGGALPSPDEMPVSPGDKAFFKRCLAWRDFLFEKDGRSRSHRVRLTLEDEAGKNDLNAQKHFTQLVLSGLSADDKAVQLRFSGQKYKSTSFNWEAGANPQIDMEARNEETGLSSAISIGGGNLVFPAFLFWEGKRDGSALTGEARVNMLFPRSGGEAAAQPVGENAAYYVVPVTISWDQTVPENIPWPSR